MLKDIIDQNLPLPQRDAMPVTVEEEIICLADKFFSKDEENLSQEKNIEKIRERLLIFGKHRLHKFNEWCAKYL